MPNFLDDLNNLNEINSTEINPIISSESNNVIDVIICHMTLDSYNYPEFGNIIDNVIDFVKSDLVDNIDLNIKIRHIFNKSEWSSDYQKHINLYDIMGGGDDEYLGPDKLVNDSYRLVNGHPRYNHSENKDHNRYINITLDFDNIFDLFKQEIPVLEKDKKDDELDTKLTIFFLKKLKINIFKEIFNRDIKNNNYVIYPFSMENHTTSILIYKKDKTDNIYHFYFFNSGLGNDNHSSTEQGQYNSNIYINFDMNNETDEKFFYFLIQIIIIIRIINNSDDSCFRINSNNYKNNEYYNGVINLNNLTHDNLYDIFSKIKNELKEENQINKKPKIKDLFKIDGNQHIKNIEFIDFQSIILNFNIIDNDMYINPQKSGSCTFYGGTILPILYLHLIDEKFDYINFQTKYIKKYKEALEEFPNKLENYYELCENNNASRYIYNIYYILEKYDNEYLENLISSFNLDEIIQILLFYKTIVEKLHIFNDLRDETLKNYSQIINKTINYKLQNKNYINSNIKFDIKDIKIKEKFSIEDKNTSYTKNYGKIELNEENSFTADINNIHNIYRYTFNNLQNYIDKVEDNIWKKENYKWNNTFYGKMIYLNNEINFTLEKVIHNFINKDSEYFNNNEYENDFFYMFDNSYILLVFISKLYYDINNKTNNKKNLDNDSKKIILDILYKVKHYINDKYYNSFYSYIINEEINI